MDSLTRLQTADTRECWQIEYCKYDTGTKSDDRAIFLRTQTIHDVYTLIPIEDAKRNAPPCTDNAHVNDTHGNYPPNPAAALRPRGTAGHPGHERRTGELLQPGNAGR